MIKRKRGKPKLDQATKKQRATYYVAPKIREAFDECCYATNKTPSVVISDYMKDYTAINSSPEQLEQYLVMLNEEIDALVNEKFRLASIVDKVKKRLGKVE
jgi:hypothetical protein